MGRCPCQHCITLSPPSQERGGGWMGRRGRVPCAGVCRKRVGRWRWRGGEEGGGDVRHFRRRGDEAWSPWGAWRGEGVRRGRRGEGDVERGMGRGRCGEGDTAKGGDEGDAARKMWRGGCGEGDVERATRRRGAMKAMRRGAPGVRSYHGLSTRRRSRPEAQKSRKPGVSFWNIFGWPSALKKCALPKAQEAVGAKDSGKDGIKRKEEAGKVER